jgi:hypothetical protein
MMATLVIVEAAIFATGGGVGAVAEEFFGEVHPVEALAQYSAMI